MLFRSDRKSTRLNSSHTIISYAVFCLKKKTKHKTCSGLLAVLLRYSDIRPLRRAQVASPSHAPDAPEATHSVPSLTTPFFFFLMNGGPPKFPPFPYTPPCR